VITHSHADACLGLDDLREFTEKNTVPVFIRRRDMQDISRIFPYLVDINKSTGSGYVSKITFQVFEENEPFDVLGLKLIPLVVEHGPNNTCLGFRFGNVAYVSDVSEIPNDTKKLLECEGGLDLLIIDALFTEKVNIAHFNLPRALKEIRLMRPKKAFLIGMSHDFDYAKTNQQLQELKLEGLEVETPFDGLKVEIHLQ